MKTPRKKSPIAPKLVGCKDPAMMRPMVPSARPLPSASNRRGKHGARLVRCNNEHPDGSHDDMFDYFTLPASREAHEERLEVVMGALIGKDRHGHYMGCLTLERCLQKYTLTNIREQARAVLLALGLSADGKEGSK